MTVTLKIVKGLRAGHLLTLTGDEAIVGRMPDCDLVLPDESVSRRHARFLQQPDGLYIEDLRSRNGTFVNGQRIRGKCKLAHKDRIDLYDVSLICLVQENADPDAVLIAQSAANFDPDKSASETMSTLQPAVITETVAEIDLREFKLKPEAANAETQLRAVVQLTQRLQNGLDLEEIHPRILETLFQIFPQIDRGCVFCCSQSEGDLKRVAVQHRDDDPQSPRTMSPVDSRIASKVLSTGKAVLNIEAGSRTGFTEGDSVFDAENRSFMCAPLVGASQQMFGVLYIDTREPLGRFVPGDLDVLATVASIAGQAIEQVTLQSARYHAVVDTAVDGIITFDERGVIESVNPAVEALFGFAKQELIGRKLQTILPDFGNELPGSNGSSRNSHNLGELGARSKDGAVIPIRLSVGEFQLQDNRHFTGILHDVTEQHRAQKALERLNDTLERQVEERTADIRLLQDIAVIANQAESVGHAMHSALQRICREMKWPVGHVYFRSEDNPDVFTDSGIWSLTPGDGFQSLVDETRITEFRAGLGMVGLVIATGKAAWTSNLAAVRTQLKLMRSNVIKECGLKTALAFPLRMAKQVVGVVEFFTPETIEPKPGFLNVMSHVGTQLGRVIERRHLQKDLIDAVWHKQRMFGQELHDSLGQELTGLGMMANSIARRLQQSKHPLAANVAELGQMIQQAKDGARRLAKGLFPVDIDAEGLRAALEDLAESTAERYELTCRLHSPRSFRVANNDIATHLFRIAQEAVTNAVKHGKPRHIDIMIKLQGHRLVLSVRDDGSGIPMSSEGRSAGIGLRIMKYRANLIGASLSIDSPKSGGTIITCTTQ